MTHSPSPGERLPFHCPAGSAYSPQWMKRPNFASRNHSSRFSRAASGALGAGVCVDASAVKRDADAKMTANGFISEHEPRAELDLPRRRSGRERRHGAGAGLADRRAARHAEVLDVEHVEHL